MKQKLKIGLLSTLFSGLLFSGCISYPEYDDYVTEQLVAITSFDTNANFKSYTTFAISDSVVIVDNDDTKKVKIGDPDYPNLSKLKEQVKQNLIKVGYTFVEGKNADLGTTLTYVESTTIYVYSSPWWWYGGSSCYWYFWSCGYYPYYPYSYPTSYSGYTAGTAIIDLFDLKNMNSQENQVSALWTGAVRGLFTSDHTEQQVNNAIADCFNQTIPFQK